MLQQAHVLQHRRRRLGPVVALSAGAGGPRGQRTRSVAVLVALHGSHSFTVLSAPPLASSTPVRLNARP